GVGESVAVKLLPRRLCADAEHLQRFVRETKALAQLEDEHFTHFISSGQVDNRPYLVMELVRGVSLKERLLQQGALRQREAVTLLMQLSGALIKAEDMRVVHRDIKPANILIAPPRPGKNEIFCAKICDFGLVKFLQDRAESLGVDEALTVSGIALGTPHYMSPEQATGERSIDHRSDMYSLAASIYHAMMGRTLFSGKTSAVIMYKQVTAAIDVEPLRERGCGPDLVALLRDMLHKEPHERPASWRDVYARSLAIMDELPIPEESDSGGEISLDPHSAPHRRIDTAVAPSPVPGMSQEIYYGRQRSLGLLLIIAFAAVVFLAAMISLLYPAGVSHRALVAGPQTLPAILEAVAESGSAQIIRLRPGIYEQAWHLGPAHAGLQVLADGPGVQLESRGQPVFMLEAGAQDIVIRGPLRISGGSGSALRIEPGASLTFDQVNWEGSGVLSVIGGSLTIHDSQIHAAIEVREGGRLRVNSSHLRHAQAPLHADQATVLLQQSRISGIDADVEDPVVLRRSSLRLQGVEIAADQASTALITQHCTWVEIREVSLRARHTAWMSDESSVGVLDRTRLQAGMIGLNWRGARDPGWTWRAIEVRAPRSSSGVDLETDPDGGPSQTMFEGLPE
ncbi:MAG: serine/threonine protein kinase, partial [Planctomycetota bacterium]